MERIKSKIIIVSLLIILNINSIQSQTYENPFKLSLSDPKNSTLLHKKKGFPGNESGHYYELEIDKSQIQGSIDLVFLVSPSSPLSDPTLSISFDKSEANDTSRINYVCKSGGLEMCMVSLADNEFPKDQQKIKVYAYVSCSNRCGYKVRADIDYDVMVNLGDDYYLNFSNTRSMTLKFKIDSDANVTKAIFGTQVINLVSLNDELQVYVNEGNKPPTSSKYDFKGIPVWKGGKGVFLREKPTLQSEKPMKKGENYTVLVESPLGTYVRFFTDQSRGNDTFSLGQIVGDILDKDENLFYNVTIEDDNIPLIADENIDFFFFTFTGATDFFLSCGMTAPKNYEDFTWKIQGSSFSTISLTPQERKSKGCDDSGFIIAVKSYMISSIEIGMYGTKYYNPGLFFGEKYFGSATNKSMQTYNLIVYEKESTNITIDLFATEGEVEFHVGSCIKGSKCTLFNFEGNDEFKSMKTEEATKFGNHYKISLQHNLENCPEIKFFMKYCLYKVFVKANSESASYQIVSTHSKISHHLSENVPERIFLLNQEIKYFRFDVLASDVLEVDVITEGISGETVTYVSREKVYPDEKTLNKVQKCIHEYDQCRVKRGPNASDTLKGPIYISVKALSVSTLSLIVKVKREKGNSTKENEITQSYMQLFGGYPVRIVLDDQEAQAHFKVHDYSLNGNKSYILFILNNLKGDHEVFISKYPKIPTPESYDYMMSSNYLLLKKAQNEIGNENTTYMILVQQSKASNFSRTEFTIEYSSPNDYKNLKWNTTSKDLLLKDYNRTYAIYVNEQKGINFAISTQSKKSSSVFYFYESNINDSSRIATIEMKNGNSHFTVKPTCSRCLLYVIAYSNFTDYASIIISEEGREIIQLKDGKMIEMNSKPEVTNYFYFIMDNEKNPLSINLLCPQSNVVFYLQINSYDINSFSKSDLVFPGKIHAAHKVYNQSANAFTFETSFLQNKGCYTIDKLCVITISVEPTFQSSESTFYIQLSSHLQEIKEGLPMTDFVKEGMFKYYVFHSHEEDVNIQLSLSPLRGDPDLFVSFGESKRPDNIDFDFSSQIRGADHIQITKNSSDIFKKSMAGTYIIGVYGYSESLFSLHVSYSKQKVFTLVPGLSQKLELYKSQEKIFEFFNFADESIHFSYIREKGDVMIYINKVDQQKDFIESFPKPENATWNFKDHFVIEKDDPNYCQNCNYIISVVSNSEISHGSFLVRSTNTFTLLSEGQPMTEYLNPNEEETYLFNFNNKEKSITFSCIIHYGDLNISYIKDISNEEKSNQPVIFTKSNFTNNKISFRLTDKDEKIDPNADVLFLFKLMASKKSKYSITISHLSGKHSLVPGQPEHVNVPGNSYKEISFTSNYSILENHPMELMVSSPVGRNVDGCVDLEFLKRANNDDLKVKNGQRREAKVIEKYSNNNSFMVNFIAEEGEYYIKLNHTTENPIDYTINLVETTQNEVLVFPDNEIVTYISEDESKTFFTIVPENRSVVLDVVSCLGGTLLNIQDYIPHFSPDGNLHYTSPSSRIHNDVFRFRLEGLIVRDQKNSSKNGTVSKLKVTFLEPDMVDYKSKFSIFPDSYVMYFTSAKDKLVTFRFNPMRCLDSSICSRVSVSYTSYRLYIGTDLDEVKMWSKCQVGEVPMDSKDSLFIVKETMISNDDSEVNIQVPFDELLKDKILYAQIIATSYLVDPISMKEFDSVTVSYSLNEFTLSTDVYESVLYQYLVVVLIGIIIVLGLIIVYWKEVRGQAIKLEKRLKYELHDVRNIVGSIPQDEELEVENNSKEAQYDELMKENK